MVRCLPLCAVIALVVGCLLHTPLDAQTKKTAIVAPGAKTDWPTFRGPNRDDHSPDTGLLKTWPKDGPPLAWKTPAKGLGKGYAAVSVVGDKVFTMGDINREGFVFALDRATGKQLWSTMIGKGGNRERVPGPGCTPTVDGDRVYAISLFGDLACLDAKSGLVKWQKNFDSDFGGQVGAWGYEESPLVDGDQVVCTPGGRDAAMVALNKMTGDVIWKSAMAGQRAEYASMVVAEVGGIRHYVQLMGKGVVGVAAKDGKLLWHYDKLGNNTANVPTPIVKGNQVFCSAGYGKGGALLQLTASGGGVTAKEVYYNPELKNKHGGVVLVGNYLYGDRDESGNPFCADFKTGKVVASWKKTSKGNGSASLTYADGHLYIRYAGNGLMTLVEATPTGFKEKGSFQGPKSGSPCWPHPVVIDGRLYLRDQDTLYCYNVKK